MENVNGPNQEPWLAPVYGMDFLKDLRKLRLAQEKVSQLPQIENIGVPPILRIVQPGDTEQMLYEQSYTEDHSF